MKEYKLKINGNTYITTVKNVDDNSAEVVVNGTSYDVDVEGMKVQKVTKTPRLVQTAAIPAGDSHPAVATTSSPAKTAASAGCIKSPLPGVILDVSVQEGDKVKIGQHLMLLEAMKMENNIDADRDGVVTSLKVRKGDSVLEGDPLVVIG
ncbi:MAG: biotin/lipoyl-containing protein [Mucinivorans sp.]